MLSAWFSGQLYSAKAQSLSAEVKERVPKREALNCVFPFCFLKPELVQTVNTAFTLVLSSLQTRFSQNFRRNFFNGVFRTV